MIRIVDIEYIPTRYTSQWKTWIPSYFTKEKIPYEIICGEDIESKPDAGAFFNFAETNIYKAQQTIAIAELFLKNEVKDGDAFLFTDGWHPGVFSLRQMINTRGLDVKICGLFHAGAYDPNDILGRTCRDAFLNTERGLLDSLDMAFYATGFSLELMLDNLYPDGKVPSRILEKVHVTGFPYEFEHLYSLVKKKQILFPHRMSIEKHPEMFEELSTMLPDYKFIFTLEECKTKDDFHRLLAESMFSVSFADQETWGISMFESLASGCIPIVPDKLSYSEMYVPDFRYKNENPVLGAYDLIRRIEQEDPRYIKKIMDLNLEHLKESYCTFEKILEKVKNL